MSHTEDENPLSSEEPAILAAFGNIGSAITWQLTPEGHAFLHAAYGTGL
jgi:hypothetical protein